MIDASRVGKAIAHLRKRAGYTQQELAEQIGISDKAVSKWERGVGLPDIAYLGKLAALLDTDTDSLLAGDMIRRGREWQGLLILNSNPCGIGADTIIYDKPIACYLLGCFLLAGIDKIMISCPEKEETYLREILADGKMLGIELEYSGETFERDLKNNAVMTDCNKVMIMFGRHLVNGAGLTRYFERSMSGKERSVLLVNPVQGVPRDRGSWLNENQKIVFPDGKQSVASSNYRQIPILFTSRKKLYDVCCGIGAFSGEKTVRSPHPIYAEKLDRGFVDFSLENWEDVAEAAAYVRIVQHACGGSLFCLEEIAWRRGMIDLKTLRELGRKKADTADGRYIMSLCK